MQDGRRLPIRIELFSRKSGSTRCREYVDWASGFPIAAAFFELEPGIQLERFELDECIEKTLAEDPAATLPIFYRSATTSVESAIFAQTGRTPSVT